MFWSLFIISSSIINGIAGDKTYVGVQSFATRLECESALPYGPGVFTRSDKVEIVIQCLKTDAPV